MIKKCLYGIGLFVSLVLVLGVGCSKSGSQSSGSDDNRRRMESSGSQTEGEGALVAKFHWLGKKRLYGESNASNLMAIWDMPESIKLEAQTLDKLSTAPWRLLKTSTLSNAPAALLRPLLDDLVQVEWYLEIHGSTNQPLEIACALRLDADRTALWQSNLPVIVRSIYSEAQSPSSQNEGFSFQTSEFRLDLVRSGNWLLFTFSDSKLTTRDSKLLADFTTRIQREGAPFVTPTTNYWAEAMLNTSGLDAVFRSNLKSNLDLPIVTVSLFGDANKVRTVGSIDFLGDIPIEMETWNIPTNLIYDPLSGFTAARGFRPLLRFLAGGDDSRFGIVPNQIFLWSQEGIPASRFFAFPSSQPSNQIQKLNDFLLKDVNPRMALFPNTTNLPLGAFEPVAGTDRVKWRGLPYVMPGLQTVDDGSNFFVAGGLFPNSLTNQMAPQALFSQVQSDSDLLLYDWEMTSSTSYALIQVSQAARFIFGKPRLSMTNNPALPWIVAISPKLGATTSSLRRVSPKKMGFSRTSVLGLTGVEIHLLSEWLESPSFPEGLFALQTIATTNASGSTQ